MAPLSTKPRLSVTSVTVGSNAFGTAWRRRTSASRSTARGATFKKSSPITSSSDERITIAYSPM